ncbi:MAG: SO_0444 family Cu/Zn efflux transporter [Candidatus Woesearchaeota archaeon]
MFLLEILKEIYSLFFEMAPYILLGLIFVAILNLFFNKDMIAKQIGKNSIGSIIKASLFGIPLPLCSCGVVPSTIYLAKNGASKGSVISFLISTPQTGIDSIIATYGILGPIFAIFRPISAFIMGILGGTAVKTFDKESLKQSGMQFTNNEPNNNSINTEEDRNFKNKIISTSRYAFIEFIDDISVQFLIGLIIAGFISYLIPEGFFSNSLISSGILAMFLMILIGIPMYVCATASIPIALTLMNIGLSPGVAFVFLVVGPATNAASLAILYKTLGKKTIIIYLITISALAIIFGYILDGIFYLFGSQKSGQIIPHFHQDGHSIFQIIISVVFLILLLASFYRKLKYKFFKNQIKIENMKHKVRIEGMNCNHCVLNVENAISKLEGVKSVKVILAENSAYIEGNYDKNELIKAVESIGYKVL